MERVCGIEVGYRRFSSYFVLSKPDLPRVTLYFYNPLRAKVGLALWTLVIFFKLKPMVCKKDSIDCYTRDKLFLLFMAFSLAVEALHAFIQDESEHKHYLIVSAVTNLLLARAFVHVTALDEVSSDGSDKPPNYNEKPIGLSTRLPLQIHSYLFTHRPNGGISPATETIAHRPQADNIHQLMRILNAIGLEFDGGQERDSRFVKMDGGSNRGSSTTHVILPNYKLGKTLGIGAFGKVKIAEHALTGHKVAIKILNRRQIKKMEMEEKVRREIKILRLFMHPHIIRLYEVIETHSDIYVVMEYVKSGELFDYIVEKGKLNEEEARRFFQQIISGVEYCHRNMVVHRDLKPENLLLDSKCNGGLYTLPSHLSPLARDLIPRMLVVDPMKRMTIREIREHPWFQAQLPRYLAVSPPDTMQQAKKIDEEILQQVVKMGFEKHQLVESLHNRIQNEATVAYYLLMDNRSGATSGYLGTEFQESTECGFSPLGTCDTPPSVVNSRMSGYMDSQGVGLRPHFPTERKWALGLQSKAHPREIMMEVLKALQELNVRWKKIGHYNMKCRWMPGVYRGYSDQSDIIGNDDIVGNSSYVVKFEVQLYKTREEKYLLDLQRVNGPQLLFLDLCAAFLAQLRVL
ncbi:hypothetical protein HPP92_009063 [Vanilla planifolia]|uniref:non-specific serine/threonine protein kinase n=1 Tax=Vanilla planifolia TaxID=51239 RepID=A0A835R5V6_VANPL|nr:hypothetical protein HPP92_009063 [Vanilla planifolia]